MYNQFKKYIRKWDQISLDVIFSDEDSRRFDEEEQKLKDHLPYLIPGAIVLTLVVFLKLNIIQNIANLLIMSIKVSDNFIMTGVEVLASLLAISITVLFFYYESNSKKYIFLDFKYFLKHKKLAFLLLMYILTLVGGLLYLLFEIPILFTIDSILILISTVSLPYFVFTCQKIVDRIYVVETLEKDLFNAIKEKRVSTQENVLKKFDFLLINSIEIRDKTLFKECIDRLHDISKFYVSTDRKFKHEHFDSIFAKDKMNLHFNWFLEEILNMLESAFFISSDKNMTNSSDYILRAINSIGIKSLNYQDNLPETDAIFQTYQKIIRKSIAKEIWSSRKQRIFQDYFQTFIMIGKNNFVSFMHHFFTEDFIIDLLKSEPQKLFDFILCLFYELRGVHSISKPNEENAMEIARVSCRTHFVSRRLEELNELQGQNSFENQRLREKLPDIIILCCLILLFHEKEALAKRCKEMYVKDKTINEKEALSRIRKNKTFLYDVKVFFGEYNPEGTEKPFAEKKFKKILKKYKSL